MVNGPVLIAASACSQRKPQSGFVNASAHGTFVSCTTKSASNAALRTGSPNLNLNLGPPPLLGDRSSRLPPRSRKVQHVGNPGQNSGIVGVKRNAPAHSTMHVGFKARNADTDGITGVTSQESPQPKRQRSSPPPFTQASCDRSAVKRTRTQGVETAATNRLVAHILAKKARLAAKLGETTARPPE